MAQSFVQHILEDASQRSDSRQRESIVLGRGHLILCIRRLGGRAIMPAAGFQPAC